MNDQRVFIVDVQEGGGVPIPQFVELSNALARSSPGQYRVMIEPADAPDPALEWLERISTDYEHSGVAERPEYQGSGTVIILVMKYLATIRRSELGRK